MAFRWEVLADPTRDSQEPWTIMKFDEPFSQESIEGALQRQSELHVQGHAPALVGPAHARVPGVFSWHDPGIDQWR